VAPTTTPTVWLNGEKIGNSSSVVGTFRTFEFDITDLVMEDNYLAVEVFQQHNDVFPRNTDMTILQ